MAGGPGADAPGAGDSGADAPRAQLAARARRVVVKIGSALIADSPVARPALVADEIAALQREREVEFAVVSSGAIALGVRRLGGGARPAALPALQAAAAVGQGELLQSWRHAFAARGLAVGQLLLTHDDIADRKRFLSARHTLRALLDAGVVPVINENDTVAVDEIKYGDNDLLAALVCNLVSADALIILTDVDGVWGEGGRRIPIVRDIDREAAPFASGSRSGVGSGGMASKVAAARAAGGSGIVTAVVPGRRADVIRAVLTGDDVGTLFLPRGPAMSSRKHWIAYGARPAGRIVVDAGAYRALVEAGRSLLPAGVIAVEGRFDLGDIVSLVTADAGEFARGLAGYRADDLDRIKGHHSSAIEATLGYKYLDEAIHRDDLVIL